jgi:hypothetical protein
VQLAAFLGVASPESSRLYQHEQIPRSSDGFIDAALRVMTPVLQPVLADFGGKSFRVSPIEALKALISLRRHGMQYIKTDIGRILHGRQLTQADFRQRGAALDDSDGDDAAAEDEVYARLLDIPMDEDEDPPAQPPMDNVEPLAPDTPASDDAPVAPAASNLPTLMDEDYKANVDQLGVENTTPSMADPRASPPVKSEFDLSASPRSEDTPSLRTPSPEVKAEENTGIMGQNPTAHQNPAPQQNLIPQHDPAAQHNPADPIAQLLVCSSLSLTVPALMRYSGWSGCD